MLMTTFTFLLLSELLGGVGKSTNFECDSSDRTSSYLLWKHNGVVLSVSDGDKYSSTITTLTVRDIVDTDEGNYTCTYGTAMMPPTVNVTQDAGCLLVYGMNCDV